MGGIRLLSGQRIKLAAAGQFWDAQRGIRKVGSCCLLCLLCATLQEACKTANGMTAASLPSTHTQSQRCCQCSRRIPHVEHPVICSTLATQMAFCTKPSSHALFTISRSPS